MEETDTWSYDDENRANSARQKNSSELSSEGQTDNSIDINDPVGKAEHIIQALRSELQKKKNQLSQAKKLLALQKQSEKILGPSELAVQLELTKKKLAIAEKSNLEKELELINTRRELQLLQEAFSSANSLMSSLQNEIQKQKNEILQ